MSVAGGFQDRADCGGAQPPGIGFPGKSLGSFRRRQGRPMAPGFGHGVIGVGGGEDLRQGLKGGGPDAAVIARTIKTLVMEGGHRCQPGRNGDATRSAQCDRHEV